MLPCNTVNCNIAIVGGGPAGTYAAMKLGEEYGKRVCLFEKEGRIGGRLYDIKTYPNLPNSTFIAVGGRRILSKQCIMINLANELGIEIEYPTTEEQFCFARGEYHFVTDSFGYNNFSHLYPGLLELNGLNGNLSENSINVKAELEKRLISRLNTTQELLFLEQSSLESYIISMIGLVGYQYLSELTRFKADFKSNISPKSYIDFLRDECRNGGDEGYPIGGMSQFPKKMEAKARDFGVRIFSSENIVSVDKVNISSYELLSKQRRIFADRVIFAVPTTELRLINGSIAESIVSQPQFKAIKSIQVMTVSQWFKKPWWKELKNNLTGKKIWRAWTTDNCIGHVEIPREDYLNQTNVIRTVYQDIPVCIEQYSSLIQTNQMGKLKNLIHRGLKTLFQGNNITNNVHIPKAFKTVVKIWPGAWFFQRGGSPYTNDEIKAWAIDPINDTNVGLASDAYNIDRSTWSQGAILSANKLLREKYNVTERLTSETCDFNPASSCMRTKNKECLRQDAGPERDSCKIWRYM